MKKNVKIDDFWPDLLVIMTLPWQRQTNIMDSWLTYNEWAATDDEWAAIENFSIVE